MGHYNSFVVRIWTDETSATFRGHIQHVASHDQANFADIRKMVDFIMNHLAQAASEQPEDDTPEIIATLRDMGASDA
jgi:hypothetical protein